LSTFLRHQRTQLPTQRQTGVTWRTTAGGVTAFMTAEPSREPSHTAISTSSTSACIVCGAALSTLQQRYCTRACQQRAYRLRHHQPARLDLTLGRAELKRRRDLLQHTVYECPTCDTRSVGDPRCTDCNTFMRRLGLGGNCPECDAVVLLTDLLREEAVVLH
jgi:hypothetical protein